MSDQKIDVVAVSYLNTKPFLHGLQQSGIQLPINLTLETPARCAQQLLDGNATIGLIPAAVVPQLPNAHIISDFCIGAEGAVKTVSLFSHVPIEEIESIYLDYQSRTSVALMRVLAQHFWKITPSFIPANQDFERQPSGTRQAAVVIGDRTIGLESHYKYVYDLAEAWQQWTGLPFVFAVWVSTRPLEESFVAQFNAALRQGVEQYREVAQQYQPLYPTFDVEAYFSRYIRYQFDAPKRKALDLYWSYLGSN